VTDQGCTPAARLHAKLIDSIIIVFVLIILSTFSSAQALKPGTCDLTQDEAAGLNPNLTAKLGGLEEYEATLLSMLANKEYAKLDCVADLVRSTKQRFPGGTWKIHVFYFGLQSPVPSPQHATNHDWEQLLQQLQAWVEARPKSVTAHIALATAYLQYAWYARGSGYSDTVSDSGWKLFSERTAEGKQILQRALPLTPKDPELYLAMLTVGQNEGWSIEQMRALFTEASNFEPRYYYYARVFANYLLPKWGGEKGDAEEFLMQTADRLGGDEGDAYYFLVANFMLCGCGSDDDPALSYPRMAKGHSALDKLYGTSMETLNRIAFLASLNGDAITALKAMDRIGDEWDREDWNKKEDFEGWKKWAVSYAPVQAKRQANEAAAEANLQTPEGRRYKTSFESSYKNIVRECTTTQPSNAEKFETLTLVGANGAVEDMKIYWTAPAALCVYQKLQASQQSKTATFAPPPKASFWVRLDLDGSEFSSNAVGK
jgi:hypothetical protein